ncbi:MAG TPA: FKBP-type peptidyl-prolyl cis-trans isomerase [Steroidobacteraceae bacterium]|nr:FKBP-type peptidyl-prolyl cis-trans isomerase [Steroidobacteraceae bacterium]
MLGAQAQTASTPAGTPGAPHPLPAPKPANPALEKSQASYSLGLSMGTQLYGLGMNETSVDYQHFITGLKAALSGKQSFAPANGQQIQTYLTAQREGIGAANKAAAEKFLAENAKRPGVVTTATGLQYRIIREGSGTPPTPSDEATVNYRGTLLNGTEFDSSYKRHQPASFPVNGVIKGWQEALVMMKPGSKWELYIPPALAYDMRSPPPIPPGSLLKFEVELLSVKPLRSAPAPAAN